MNNALSRDLKRLVRRVELSDKKMIAQDSRRLRFHLMPPVGWLNDPNGLCWYKGNYHVFYQYAPFDANGGVKCWGHWKSPDLLHWKQEPVMLFPDQTWDIHGVYSGSALIEDDAMYLYYTGNVKYPGNYDYITAGRGHNVALAVSRDGSHVDSNRLLLENKDYPADVSCHVRDPKVWAQDGKYYMVLGARTLDDRGELLIYESDDKLSWRQINVIRTPEKFGYMWECPDLFCVDGQWIVMASPQGLAQDGVKYQNIYSCGYFPLYGDFRTDYTLGAYEELDAGFDFYAPQTFVAPDGRRILIGWLGMPDAPYTNPTAAESGWQHCLSVPRELHWNGTKLTQTPVRELEQLRADSKTVQVDGQQEFMLSAGTDMILKNEGTELRLAFGADAAIEWQNGRLALQLGAHAGAGRDTRVLELAEPGTLRMLIDTSSIELFAGGGAHVMSTRWYPDGADKLTICGRAAVQLYDMQAMQMELLEYL